MYIEPAPALELNNLEAQLADEEAQEETTIQLALSRLVGSRAEVLHGLLAAVVALDVIAARAQHAQWLGAVRPRFVSRCAVATIDEQVESDVSFGVV